MTGLKASTLFWAYEYAREIADYHFRKLDEGIYSETNERLFDMRDRQKHKFLSALTEKLEAQEKELEELRETASELAEIWHDVYEEDVVITP